MNKYALAMLAGIVLVAASLLAGGAGLIAHTAEHVYEDLTIDLLPHLFLLGMIMALYGIMGIAQNRKRLRS